MTLGFLFDSLDCTKKENMDGFKFEKSRELLVLFKYFLVLNLFISLCRVIEKNHKLV